MNDCNPNTCGAIYPSTCINYTASTPLQGLSFTGTPNLDIILQLLAKKIDDLGNALDISTADKSCFAFNPAADPQRVFLIELISKICAIETEIGTLQDKLNNISASVLSVPINFDIKCLLPNPNPCGNVFTLEQLLQLIINKLCP